MEPNWVYHDIDLLHTPCGDITVQDEEGQRYSFSVRPNPFNMDYHFLYGTEREVAVNTVTNYEISVPSDRLRPGRRYIFRLDGIQLDFGDSDENTFAYSGTGGEYSIAIGYYDPNDEVRDRRDFKWYIVSTLDDQSGFRFTPLGDMPREICFKTAWIKREIEAGPDEDPGDYDYERAVQFWTT